MSYENQAPDYVNGVEFSLETLQMNSLDGGDSMDCLDLGLGFGQGAGTGRGGKWFLCFGSCVCIV